jgi:LysR family hydrogen peroxide-inducible transcriptional activator
MTNRFGAFTLRELQYLVAVADEGHFGRAAQACNVSQPTLSMQFKKLEDGLGVVLVERANKRVVLTAAGERVVAQARRVLQEAAAITSIALSLQAPLAGPLHLGIFPSLAPYLLPWAIPAVKSAFTDLSLIVHEETTDHVLERLGAHTLDAALLALPVEAPDLDTIALFDEPFVFACHEGDALAKAKTVAAEDIPHDHLLLLTDGHCFRDQALEVCNLSLTQRGSATDVTATSLETLKQLVSNAEGCTLLPIMATKAVDKKSPIKLKPLAKAASRRIGLVWRASHPQAEHFGSFADVLRRAVPKSVHPIHS